MRLHAPSGGSTLEDNVLVRSCYEAGRDGFWLHRYLHAGGGARCVDIAGAWHRGRRSPAFAPCVTDIDAGTNPGDEPDPRTPRHAEAIAPLRAKISMR